MVKLVEKPGGQGEEIILPSNPHVNSDWQSPPPAAEIDILS